MSNTFENVQSSYVDLPSTTDGVHQPKIHIRSTNPPSKPTTPTVVFITGLGSPCLSFAAAQHHLAILAIPSITYDRLGTGRSSALQAPPKTHKPSSNSGEKNGSEKPPPRPASLLALELAQVLRLANVKPPYILAPHSYGGIIAWEYIAAHPSHVIGLLALDANTARSPGRPVREQDLSVLWENLPEGRTMDYFEIVGLNAANRLPADLWEEASGKREPPEGWESGIGGEEAETAVCEESCRALLRLGLLQTQTGPLGKWPVTVIKGDTEGDIRKLIDASEALGGGREGVSEVLRGRLEGYGKMDGEMQREHLMLTETGVRRYVEAERSGHWVHVMEPKVVVEEIVRLVGEVERAR